MGKASERTRLRNELRNTYREQSDYIRKFGSLSAEKQNLIESLRKDLKRVDKRSVEVDSEVVVISKKKPKSITKAKAKRSHQKKIIGVCAECGSKMHSIRDIYEFMGSWYCSRECRTAAVEKLDNDKMTGN